MALLLNLSSAKPGPQKKISSRGPPLRTKPASRYSKACELKRRRFPDEVYHSVRSRPVFFGLPLTRPTPVAHQRHLFAARMTVGSVALENIPTHAGDVHRAFTACHLG